MITFGSVYLMNTRTHEFDFFGVYMNDNLSGFF